MLAKELEVSRTPVREAIAMLQAEGLLEGQQHRGAQVRSYTPGELEEIYDLRSILEGYAARRAATRITPRELARLRNSVERMEKLKPKDLEQLVQQNGIFHDTILQAADSQRLVAMVTQTRALPLIYQSYAWYTRSSRRCRSSTTGASSPRSSATTPSRRSTTCAITCSTQGSIDQRLRRHGRKGDPPRAVRAVG